MNRYLYIKIDQRCQLKNKKVYLKDIASIYCNDNTLSSNVGDIVLTTFENQENETKAYTIMFIINLITKQYKDVEVINLGETDFIVEHITKPDPSNVLQYIKAGIVALILFFGSGFTIMTFNQDVSVADLFAKICSLFAHSTVADYNALKISYSIGIGLGILLFFNHFRRNKLVHDPTPMQIEMRSYESDINDAIIKNSSREGKTKDV